MLGVASSSDRRDLGVRERAAFLRRDERYSSINELSSGTGATRTLAPTMYACGVFESDSWVRYPVVAVTNA